MPRITNETIYEDGGYACTVESYWGLAYAVSYVMNEVRVHGLNAGSSTPHKRIKIAAEAARKLATTRIAELGPDFRAAHLALYADEIAAKAEGK